MSDLLQQPLDVIRRIQNDKLKTQLKLCARGHEFYRAQWKQADIDIEAIHSLQDLAKLPLTNKHDLMADPERFRLRFLIEA